VPVFVVIHRDTDCSVKENDSVSAATSLLHTVSALMH
jgi:hypothetical protein